MSKPAFYSMTTTELARWVEANNVINGEAQFDCFPAIDEVDDEELAEAHEEYEAMADELWNLINA